MSAPDFRTPGLRLPIPSFLACLGVGGFCLVGWMMFSVMAEEQMLDALFQPNANSMARAKAAELWAKKGEEALPRLREALASEDASTREFGLLAFIYMPKHEARLAFEDFLRLCEDDSPEVQASALVLVAQLTFTPEKHAPLIASRLLSDNQELLDGAARGLEKLGPLSVPYIANVLAQTQPEVQKTCLKLLARAAFDEKNGELAVETIAKSFNSPHAKLRLRAYELVSGIRPLTSEEISRGIADSHDPIVELALQEWPRGQKADSQVVPKLARMLNNQPELRGLVLNGLGNCGLDAGSAFEDIVFWTEDQDPDIKIAAATALVKVANPQEKTHRVLMRLLRDADPNVARHAGQLTSETISETNASKIVREILLPRLQSNDEAVQISAAAALAGMPQAAISQRQTLARLLLEESADHSVPQAVKFQLAEVLGNMGPAAADSVAAVLHLIHQSSPKDEQLIIPVTALGKIGASTPAVLDCLIHLHNQPSRRRSPLPLAVIEALGKVGTDNHKVLELLALDVTRSHSSYVRFVALRALGDLQSKDSLVPTTYTQALQDENPNIRMEACLKLQKIGHQESSVADLTMLLEDGNYSVRILAAHTLAQFGPKARLALPGLSAALSDESNYFPISLHDEDEVRWDLFDESIQSLKRGSVHQKVRLALSAIHEQDELNASL